jgi:outer membrane lipoprotein SlyB
MRKTAIAIAFVALTLAGCKSKQDQLTEIYAQLDAMNTQYQKDCMLAPVDVIARSQAKCKAERDAMEPASKKFAALQADIAASKH